MDNFDMSYIAEKAIQEVINEKVIQALTMVRNACHTQAKMTNVDHLSTEIIDGFIDVVIETTKEQGVPDILTAEADESITLTWLNQDELKDNKE